MSSITTQPHLPEAQITPIEVNQETSFDVILHKVLYDSRFNDKTLEDMREKVARDVETSDESNKRLQELLHVCAAADGLAVGFLYHPVTQALREQNFFVGVGEDALRRQNTNHQLGRDTLRVDTKLEVAKVYLNLKKADLVARLGSNYVDLELVSKLNNSVEDRSGIDKKFSDAQQIIVNGLISRGLSREIAARFYDEPYPKQVKSALNAGVLAPDEAEVLIVCDFAEMYLDAIGRVGSGVETKEALETALAEYGETGLGEYNPQEMSRAALKYTIDKIDEAQGVIKTSIDTAKDVGYNNDTVSTIL